MCILYRVKEAEQNVIDCITQLQDVKKSREPRTIYMKTSVSDHHLALSDLCRLLYLKGKENNFKTSNVAKLFRGRVTLFLYCAASDSM